MNPLRRPLPAATTFALLATSLLTACGARPRAVGDFSTPTAAVRSLQSALEDEDSLELYRCLSEGLKQRIDLGVLGADIALQHLLREYPEIRYLEEGEILSEQRLDADRALVEVEVGFLFFTRRVRFGLERRLLAELQREGGAPPIGAFLAPGTRVRDFAQRAPQTPDLAIVLRGIPDLWEQLEFAEPPITAFRVLDVWKVHAIGMEESEPTPRSAAAEEDGSLP
jgi:hypothetical protein